MMFLGSMALCDEDLTLTIRDPESRDTIYLIRSSLAPFDIFDDVIIFIDDGYEWHNRRKICNSEKK